jgi:hypothetical protein
MRRIVLCLSLLALTGCGASSGVPRADHCGDRRSYSVEEVVEKRPRGVVEVEGYIASRDGETRLCSSLLESHPPQCGNPSLRLPGPPPRGDGVESAQDVTWTEEEQRILGSLRKDTLLRVGCA